jgi:uncharacterized membrane protein required for colicin V production
MLFDVFIILIILVFAFFGLKNGLVQTIFRTFGWLIAIAAAFFLNDPAQEFVKDRTNWFEYYHAHVEKVCIAFLDKYTGGIPGSVPGAFGDAIDSAGQMVATEAANTITNISFSVVIFLSLILATKLVLFILTFILSRKYHKGFVGGVDGFAGMLVGILQGVLVVLVLLAILLPISFSISVDLYTRVTTVMNGSIFTGILYELNPLLALVDGYIPGNLLPANWFNKGDYQYQMKDWGNMI